MQQGAFIYYTAFRSKKLSKLNNKHFFLRKIPFEPLEKPTSYNAISRMLFKITHYLYRENDY